jgi:type IV pilus assembly protein PilV
MNPTLSPKYQGGTTLVEVLVTMIILAFGLLGLAAFQSKVQMGSIESYQRAQAVILLADMQARMNGNPQFANDYAGGTVYGTGDATTSCAGLVGVARDKCEWSLTLQGSGEIGSNGTTKLGAMNGARGCITLIRARNATDNLCASGIYLVSVAWQGMHETIAPTATCGSGQYGAETLRRVISARVVAGVPECVFI